MVLSEVFEACDVDSECSSLLDGDAQAAYDELAGKLAEAPIVYEYSFPAGKKVEHNFTLRMLDFTTAYHLYGLDSRMDLMRALAAAQDGDMRPMANLFFEVSNIDPATGEYAPLFPVASPTPAVPRYLKDGRWCSYVFR